MTSSSPAGASLSMFEQPLGCYPEGARQAELRESANDSLRLCPCWGAAVEKIQAWLEL